MTLSFSAQPLTDYIWLGGDPSYEERIRTTTRIFMALTTSLSELHEFYTVLDVSTPKPVDSCMPYIHSINGQTLDFQYLGRLMPENRRQAVFEAHTPNGEKLVVKFIQRYNAAAHQLLASHGLAPTLRYAEPCSGGWMMVVMDFVMGKNAHSRFSNSRLPKDLVDRVRKALDLLHGEGFVFGDLRVGNIMVTQGQKSRDGIATDELGVMLVDFDWCVEAEVSRYPLTLNDTGTIEWPAGVERNSVMYPKHDLDLLEAL